jgi:hypothetical protein
VTSEGRDRHREREREREREMGESYGVRLKKGEKKTKCVRRLRCFNGSDR